MLSYETSEGYTRQAALDRQELSCTFLAHHELESIVTVIVAVIIIVILIIVIIMIIIDIITLVILIVIITLIIILLIFLFLFLLLFVCKGGVMHGMTMGRG